MAEHHQNNNSKVGVVNHQAQTRKAPPTRWLKARNRSVEKWLSANWRLATKGATMFSNSQGDHCSKRSC